MQSREPLRPRLSDSARERALHSADPQPRGHLVTGPAFTVWDEDPRHAREWGAELARAWRRSSARRP